MIPKVIHYCWFGGKTLPKDVKKCIKSWKKYCPDYQIIEWNEKNFDVTCHHFIKAAYASKDWAFVSDYARLKVIYDNGGIYLDTDVEVIKNLDPLLLNECYVGVQKHGRMVNTGLGFGAEKNNRIVKAMLDEYDLVVFDESKKEQFTCPILNSRVLQKEGYQFSTEIVSIEGARVYPSRFFDPYSTGEMISEMCGDTYSIHHYSASWTRRGNRIKRRIAGILGEKNSFALKRFLKQKYK